MCMWLFFVQIILGDIYMSRSFPNIGWSVDKFDENTSQTSGTNTILARLAAMQLQAETDRSLITLQEFQTVMAELGKRLTTITPEEFFGGADSGTFLGPLVTAFGADASGLPATPSFVTGTSDKIIKETGVEQTVGLSSSITAGAEIVSIGWAETVDADNIATVTDSTVASQSVVIGAGALAGNTCTIQVTYTYDGVATATHDVVITVA